MLKINNRDQKGFTIIELLVATTVFSIVLVVFLSAFLRISQLFYKGVNMARTQEAARNVIGDISDDIQFYQQAPIPGGNFFCIGIHRYSFNPGTQVGPPGSYGIARDIIAGGCPAPTDTTQPLDLNKAEELLDPGMQVNQLNVSCLKKLCTVSMRIVFYGSDNSVLVSPSGVRPAWKAADAQCSGPPSSSQYCATADYNATILQSF